MKWLNLNALVILITVEDKKCVFVKIGQNSMLKNLKLALLKKNGLRRLIVDLVKSLNLKFLLVSHVEAIMTNSFVIIVLVRNLKIVRNVLMVIILINQVTLVNLVKMDVKNVKIPIHVMYAKKEL